MMNILKENKTILILISSILVLVSSLSGCIGNGNDTDSNEYSTGNTIEIDSNIIYPHSKPCGDVPGYYYNIIGITTEGITLSIYETTDNVEDILKWYRNKLSTLGYDVVVNATIAKISGPYGTIEYGMIIFKREKDAIGIWAMKEPLQERTIYFVGKGPADKILGSVQPSESTEVGDSTPSTPDYNEVEKPQLPSSDKTSGEEPIQRYPNSVMLEHTVVTIDGKKYIYIKYGTDKDPEDVFNWYKENIKREGWNIIYTLSDGNAYYITCDRDDNNEVVAIAIDKGEYTIINIEYMVTQ
ncbi:MAG TPA: hypothetical protein EYH53_04275 [Methanothermococcus okinawensis]|nr:hypothetical protein [Methanothermococcus okinawensis]